MQAATLGIGLTVCPVEDRTLDFSFRGEISQVESPGFSFPLAKIPENTTHLTEQGLSETEPGEVIAVDFYNHLYLAEVVNVQTEGLRDDCIAEIQLKFADGQEKVIGVARDGWDNVPFARTTTIKEQQIFEKAAAL